MTTRRKPRKGLPKKEICQYPMRILIMAMTVTLPSTFVPYSPTSTGWNRSKIVYHLFLFPLSSTPPIYSTLKNPRNILEVHRSPVPSHRHDPSNAQSLQTGHRTDQPNREIYIIIFDILAMLSKFQSRMRRHIWYWVYNSIDNSAMVAVELHSWFIGTLRPSKLQGAQEIQIKRGTLQWYQKILLK